MLHTMCDIVGALPAVVDDADIAHEDVATEQGEQQQIQEAVPEAVAEGAVRS